MRDERLERNWKMANAASPNTSKPPTRVFLENYDEIFKKKKLVEKRSMKISKKNVDR